jgi:hypothetical protein
MSANRASRSGLDWLVAWRGLRMPAACASLSSAAPDEWSFADKIARKLDRLGFCRVVLAVRAIASWAVTAPAALRSRAQPL